jgi:hypothetical protein
MANNLNKSLIRSFIRGNRATFSTLNKETKRSPQSPFFSVDGTVHYPVMHREISEFVAEFMRHRD